MKILGTTLNLIEANQQIAVLEKDLSAVNESKASIEASIETLKVSHATELADQKAAHQTALDEANGKIQLLTEANQTLEEKQESASQQAVKVLSQVGVERSVEDNQNTEVNTVDKSMEDLWTEHEAISDQKERRAFYLENIKPRRK